MPIARFIVAQGPGEIAFPRRPGLASRAWSAILQRRWYWCGSLVLVLGIPFVVGRYEDNEIVRKLQYKEYRVALACLPWRPYARETTIVIIDDDTYWKGEPAGRVPLNRRFLAQLVKDVAKYHPAVIAIDVNLRSEDPTGKQRAPAHKGALQLPVAPEFAEETANLLEAIRETSRTCHVVLAKTIERKKFYFAQSDVYDGFDFAPPGEQQSKVSWGYVSLPDDVRYVPRVLRLADDSRLDSFALAAVRARQARALKGTNSEKKRLSLFLAPEDMVSITVSTLRDPQTAPSELSQLLEGQIALIGGNWSSRALDLGPHVDNYDTPFGELPGVFIHANYIEGLLARRTVTPVPVATVMDIIAGAVFAFLLGMELRPSVKLGVLLGTFVISFIITIELLLHFAILCDLIAINIGLTCHLIAEPYFKSLFDWLEPRFKLLWGRLRS